MSANAKKAREVRITKETLRVAIAKNLRDARACMEPPITQEDVANFFNPPLTRAAIGQWEVGETLPDIDRLCILSKAYGRTIDSLVFGDEEPKHNGLTPEVLKIARACLKLAPKDRAVIFYIANNMGKA